MHSKAGDKSTCSPEQFLPDWQRAMKACSISPKSWPWKIIQQKLAKITLGPKMKSIQTWLLETKPLKQMCWSTTIRFQRSWLSTIPSSLKANFPSWILKNTTWHTSHQQAGWLTSMWLAFLKISARPKEGGLLFSLKRQLEVSMPVSQSQQLFCAASALWQKQIASNGLFVAAETLGGPAKESSICWKTLDSQHSTKQSVIFATEPSNSTTPKRCKLRILLSRLSCLSTSAKNLCGKLTQRNRKTSGSSWTQPFWSITKVQIKRK